VTAARASRYPIRAAARMTGLSVDTLRAWERRYEAVVPARGERGRTYTIADVERLKQLATLVEGGHAIGQIATLSNAALARLRPPVPPAHAAPGPVVDLDPIRHAIKHYDLPAFESLLNRQAVILPATELIFSAVLPILRDLGERWEAGSVRPAQEHFVSAVIRSVLGGLLRTMPRTADARTLLLATPAGERHELALLSAAVLAAARGFAVVYLGPDLPVADIAHATAAAGADILLIGMTIPNAIEPAELRKLSRLPARIQIWAGGPHAADAREALGTRARVIGRLEDLPDWLERHAA
jgi:DNA-binding transcriptional MerR regulator